MSFYHPFPRSLLHFPMFFLFLMISSYSSSREKAGSRRLLAKPVSTLSCMVLTFTFSHYLVRFTFPFLFTSSLSIMLPLSRIFVFHCSSHWPINHLCWREQPAVLCNFLFPEPSLVYKAKHGLTDCSLSLF